MQDILFKKIADTLFEMCKENQIGVITYFEVEIQVNSQVNKQSLLNYLIEEIPELVNYNTKIKINESKFNVQTVMKTVEGV
ncbi:hypothetical protein KHQ81_02560 [Mycoplasmatota bacterium]|nr:hypothetical protein KHQ81_02560 [Mycoplasmatota bacterium]